MIGLLLAGLLSLFNTNAMADTLEDGRYWLNLFMQGKLAGEQWYWSMDTHARWRNEGQHFDTLILRPAVFYKLDPKTSLWLGYDTVNNHPDGRPSFRENRLWQQFTYQFDPIGDINILSRSRLEQRDREDFSEVAHRWRQMLRITGPSGLHPQLSWVVYDELFVQLNTTAWVTRKGIDQNRLFLGVNWKWDAQMNGDIGYMNQYVNSRNLDQENHILMTTLRLNF